MQAPVEVDPVVLLAAGLLAGEDGLGLVRFDDPTLARNLGVVALIVILFEGA